MKPSKALALIVCHIANYAGEEKAEPIYNAIMEGVDPLGEDGAESCLDFVELVLRLPSLNEVLTGEEIAHVRCIPGFAEFMDDDEAAQQQAAQPAA